MKRTILCLLSGFTLFAVTSCGYAVEEIEGNTPVPAASILAETVLENPTEETPTTEALKLEDGGMAETGNMQETETLSKEELYYRCMNTLLYMDQISGHIMSKDDADSTTIFEGTIAYDFVKKEYYTVSNSWLADDPECCVQTNQVYGSNGALTTFCDYQEGSSKFNDGVTLQDSCIIYRSAGFDQSKYEIEVPKDSTNAALPDEWITVEEAEAMANEPSFYLTNGSDPTGAHELAGCFMPQEMSSGFMSDFSKWEIAGTEELDGRTCTVVKGITTESYGKQLGLATFEIWVDQETGVWLWYEGYDENGEVQSYVYTDNMQFGSDAEPVTCLTVEMLHEKIDDGHYALSSFSTMSIEELEAACLMATTK